MIALSIYLLVALCCALGGIYRFIVNEDNAPHLGALLFAILSPIWPVAVGFWCSARIERWWKGLQA
jgi:hypothetical protein